MKNLVIKTCCLVVIVYFSLLLSLGQTIPKDSKLFIAPMDQGLNTYIQAEIMKKKIPVIIVTDDKDSDYVMTGTSNKEDDKWYHTVFGGKDKATGSVAVIDAKSKQVIWATEAGDRSLWFGGIKRGGLRKVADRIVNDLKKVIK